MYQLDICFTYESFYHLADLQHLPDITYPSKNKERIYKDICNRKIKYETIDVYKRQRYLNPFSL